VEKEITMKTATTLVPSLIFLDDEGRARIQGTRFKVIHLARDCRAGLDVDALHHAYPDLSLAQIHAALSYYYAHKDDLDAQMERAEREVETHAADHPNAVTREELLKRLDRE
jgi:uncharacterized protein (DUF433 family)